MKTLLTLLFILGSPLYTMAQDCGCDKVAKESRAKGGYGQDKAQNIINELKQGFDNSQLLFIEPRPYPCPRLPLFAEICNHDNGNYIFYDPKLMADILAGNRWGDKFLLAHEISHHVLGHTQREQRLTDGMKRYLSNLYRGTRYVNVYKNNKKDTAIVNILFRHLQELEADALGLWMVAGKGALQKDLSQIFDALPNIFEPYVGKINKDKANSDYPSFDHRKKMLEKMFVQFQGEVSKTNDKLTKKGKSTNGKLGFLYNDMKVKEEFSQDIGSYYALLIQQSERDELDSLGKELQKAISFRNKLYFEIVGGTQVRFPSFNRNDVPITATTPISPSIGLRIGIGRWYKKHHVETDIRWNTNHFETQLMEDNQPKNLESFRIQQLHIQPRYVYGRLKKESNYRSLSSGWMVSAGLSIQWPFSYSYENLTAELPHKPTIRPSVGGVIGIGFGQSSWFSRRGHWRLWLSYNLQPLNFAESTVQNIYSIQHTVNVDLSYRLW
ncbi:M48 family metalloprotease [Runella aurantiaca]|uniref:Peptidase M48 domain-containing protein n=1 Tax=Runella aurantiaca TaxID=2282308 RepID=A0A369IJS5_9BACT|nr:M48 family metalloprotease [Runella aurantiaca]RDB07514.1 hypothetical protein DVG78_00140 [Runella aurantiaca]